MSYPWGRLWTPYGHAVDDAATHGRSHQPISTGVMPMASAHDVAAFILGERGPMSAMKLQKLVYYAQAWQLVWEERPLFEERIEAWANGPVVPALYRVHRGQFVVDAWPKGDPDALDEGEAESVRAVLDYYGDWPAHQLSELTHREAPWRDARAGLAPGERGDREIPQTVLYEFYDGLTTADQ
jgi:uncharacterized phage-associated protein